jgi:hypothetical protein
MLVNPVFYSTKNRLRKTGLPVLKDRLALLTLSIGWKGDFFILAGEKSAESYTREL